MGNEQNGSKVRDVIDATNGLFKAVPVYDDMVQPAAKQIGSALGTIAKTINLALEPISGMIWSYEKIKEFVSIKVAEKLQNIPQESIVTPNPNVAGPVLESLRYTGYEENLREMYANLLANALDKNTKNEAHPSYAEIIRQLSPSEARLLSILSGCSGYPRILTSNNRKIMRGGAPPFYNQAFNRGFASINIKTQFKRYFSESEEPVDTAFALDNFIRLRLIEIEITTTQDLKETPTYLPRIGNSQDNLSEKLILEITTEETLVFSDFGMKFVDICIKNKT